MEVWTEVRRRVLNREISKRAACEQYKLHWKTLEKILAHVEPPGYRRTSLHPPREDALDIADAKMVVLKTASNFQFFARWRKHLIRCDTPGTTQSDLRAFNWRRQPRPVYPLDPLDRPF